jgi:hypothetical protein
MPLLPLRGKSVSGKYVCKTVLFGEVNKVEHLLNIFDSFVQLSARRAVMFVLVTIVLLALRSFF